MIWVVSGCILSSVVDKTRASPIASVLSPASAGLSITALCPAPASRPIADRVQYKTRVSCRCTRPHYLSISASPPSRAAAADLRRSRPQQAAEFNRSPPTPLRNGYKQSTGEPRTGRTGQWAWVGEHVGGGGVGWRRKVCEGARNVVTLHRRS